MQVDVSGRRSSPARSPTRSTRAAILGQKIVTGDTSTWTRPAQFHITCPALQLDIDIEPPVGPGGPGTYIIGQGSIPPATCTISEIDTGTDSTVQVSMVMTNHGVPIASGTTRGHVHALTPGTTSCSR